MMQNIETQDILCSEEDCDIEYKKGIRDYRRFRLKCIHSLVGDPQNSVQAQLKSMIARQAFFEAAELVRGKIIDAQTPSALRSGALQDFMDAGYIATQAMAFRRLVDTSDDVNSLGKIFKWIEGNRKILTREMFVSWDGVVYDGYNVVVQAKNGESDLDGSFYKSINRHEDFDALCGGTIVERSRNHTVESNIISEMRAHLESQHIKEACLTATKIIAHSVVEENREGAADGLMRHQIDEGLAGLVKAGSFVASLFDVEFLQHIVPGFGIARNLDFPFVPSELKNEFSVKWSKMMSRYEG